jgi:hypothetical protein
LTLGLVVERSGSLWPSVVLHALWNIMLLVIAFPNAQISLSWGPPQNALEGILVLAGIGLSCVVMLRLMPRQEPRADRVDPEPVLEQEAA